MARNGVSDAQVREIIEELQAEQSAVTITTIRDRLGTGSYSTISRALSSWREEQKNVRQSSTPEPPEVVSALMRRLWEEAYGAADKHHDAERQAFAQQQSQFQRTEKELLDAVSMLENRAQQQESVNSRLTEELSQAQDALKTANMKLEGVREDLKGIKDAKAALRKQLDEALTRAAAGEASLEAARKELAKLETQLERARNDEKASSQRMEAWIERATKAETVLKGQQRG